MSDQLTERQEEALESTYIPTLPVQVEHHPEDARQCRWHVVDAVGECVEAFQTEQDASLAAQRVTDFYSA